MSIVSVTAFSSLLKYSKWFLRVQLSVESHTFKTKHKHQTSNNKHRHRSSHIKYKAFLNSFTSVHQLTSYLFYMNEGLDFTWLSNSFPILTQDVAPSTWHLDMKEIHCDTHQISHMKFSVHSDFVKSRLRMRTRKETHWIEMYTLAIRQHLFLFISFFSFFSSFSFSLNSIRRDRQTRLR